MSIKPKWALISAMAEIYKSFILADVKILTVNKYKLEDTFNITECYIPIPLL